jgi:hypothetical protein
MEVAIVWNNIVVGTKDTYWHRSQQALFQRVQLYHFDWRKILALQNLVCLTLSLQPIGKDQPAQRHDLSRNQMSLVAYITC